MSRIIWFVVVVLFFAFGMGNISPVKAQIRRGQPDYAQRHRQYQQAPQKKGLKAFRKKKTISNQKLATKKPNYVRKFNNSGAKVQNQRPKTAYKPNYQKKSINKARITQSKRPSARKNIHNQKKIKGGLKPFKQPALAQFKNSGQPSYRKLKKSGSWNKSAVRHSQKTDGKRPSGYQKQYKSLSSSTKPKYTKRGNGNNARKNVKHSSYDNRRPSAYKKEFKYLKEKPRKRTRYTATKRPHNRIKNNRNLDNRKSNYSQNFRAKNNGFQRVRTPNNQKRNKNQIVHKRRQSTHTYANKHRKLDRRTPSTGLKVLGVLAAPFAWPFIKKNDVRKPNYSKNYQRKSLDGRKPYAFNKVKKGGSSLDRRKPNYRNRFAKNRSSLDRQRPFGYKKQYVWLKEKPKNRSKYKSAGTNRSYAKRHNRLDSRRMANVRSNNLRRKNLDRQRPFGYKKQYAWLKEMPKNRSKYKSAGTNRSYAKRHNRLDSRRMANVRSNNSRRKSLDSRNPSRATKVLGILSLPVTWPFLLLKNTDSYKPSKTYKNRHNSRDFNRPKYANRSNHRGLDRQRPFGYKKQYAWLKEKPKNRSHYKSAGTNRKYASKHNRLDSKRNFSYRNRRRGLDRQRPLGYKKQYAWLKEKPKNRTTYKSAGTNRKYASKHNRLDSKRNFSYRNKRRGLDRQRPEGYKKQHTYLRDKPRNRQRYHSAGTRRNPGTITTIGAILIAPVAWPFLLFKKNLDNRRAKSYADRHRSQDSRRFPSYKNRHRNQDSRTMADIRFKRRQLDQYRVKSYAFKRSAHDSHRFQRYANRHAMLDGKRPSYLRLKRSHLDEKRIIGMNYKRHHHLDQKRMKDYVVKRQGPNNTCQPRLIIRHRNYDLACMPQNKPLKRRQLDLACTEKQRIVRHRVVDRLCYETNKVCHIPMKDYRVPCDPNIQAPTSNMERVGKELKYFFTNKKKYCKINSVYSGVSAGQVVETEEYGIAVVSDFIIKDRILKYPEVVYGRKNKKVKEKVREKKIKGVRNLVVMVPKDPKKMRKKNGQANLKKVILSHEETKQIMIRHLMKKDNMLWIVRMYPEEEQNIPILRVKFGLDKEIHHPAFRK